MDAARSWTMLLHEEEEEGVVGRGSRLAQRLHPRGTVRSLNGKPAKLTGVIWTVRFWSTSSAPASPNPNFPNPELPRKQIFSHYVSITFTLSRVTEVHLSDRIPPHPPLPLFREASLGLKLKFI